LRRAGIERRVAVSGVVVDTFSYYCAYAICVAMALVLAAADGSLTAPIAAIGVSFAIGSTAFALGVLTQFGLRGNPLRAMLERRPFIGQAVQLLRDIDPRLAHSGPVLRPAIGWQMSIQVLDATTLWLLLFALGAPVDARTAFTSYMFSALFRTLSVSPGGLGTYEAAAVMMLKSAGVTLESAFSATLLFRTLNFWLPMLPGMWCARRILRP
jgi:Mg2+-importing ATPase